METYFPKGKVLQSHDYVLIQISEFFSEGFAVEQLAGQLLKDIAPYGSGFIAQCKQDYPPPKLWQIALKVMRRWCESLPPPNQPCGGDLLRVLQQNCRISANMLKESIVSELLGDDTQHFYTTLYAAKAAAAETNATALRSEPVVGTTTTVHPSDTYTVPIQDSGGQSILWPPLLNFIARDFRSAAECEDLAYELHLVETEEDDPVQRIQDRGKTEPKDIARELFRMWLIKIRDRLPSDEERERILEGAFRRMERTDLFIKLCDNKEVYLKHN